MPSITRPRSSKQPPPDPPPRPSPRKQLREDLENQQLDTQAILKSTQRVLRAGRSWDPRPARTSNNHDLLLLSAQLGAEQGAAHVPWSPGARVSDIYPSTDEGENSPSSLAPVDEDVLSVGDPFARALDKLEQTVTAPPPPRSPAAPPPPRSPAPPTRSPLPARSPQRRVHRSGRGEPSSPHASQPHPPLPPSGPSLREMVLEEELKTAREELSRLDASSRSAVQTLQQQLSMANQRLHKKDLRLTSAQAAADAAAEAARKNEPPAPLAHSLETSMETLVELCEQGTRELALMVELHEAGVASYAHKTKDAMESSQKTAENEIARAQALADEVAKRDAIEARLTEERNTALAEKAELERALEAEVAMRRAEEVALEQERSARVSAEAEVEELREQLRQDTAARMEAVAAAKADQAKAEARAEEEAAAAVIHATAAAKAEAAREAAEAKNHDVLDKVARLESLAALGKSPPQGVPPQPPKTTSSVGPNPQPPPLLPAVAVVSQSSEEEEKASSPDAREAASSWLARNMVQSPGSTVGAPSPHLGGPGQTPLGTMMAAANAYIDAGGGGGGGGTAASGAVEPHLHQQPSMTSSRSASSCSEYLHWRRQVHGLINLPAPVRGVASSASWGLTEPPSVPSEPPSRAPLTARQPAAARQHPVVPASAAGGGQGGLVESLYAQGVAAENEFAQASAQLQSEMEIMLDDLSPVKGSNENKYGNARRVR